MLRAVSHACNGEHFRPHFKEKHTDFFTHRHVIEHVAHLNGVLDGHGFFLFNLLGNTHHTGSAAFLRQKSGKKLLKFVVNQLKHALTGLGVLLNDLHHPFDLCFHGAAGHVGIKAQHRRAHPINQPTRRMLQRPKKLRLGNGNAQHRHLQTGKPDTYRWWNAVFGQNTLKHERDNFNRRLFGGGSRRPLEADCLLAQSIRSLRDMSQTIYLAGRISQQSLIAATFWRHHSG